jgi:nitrogen fixation protein FixH
MTAAPPATRFRITGWHVAVTVIVFFGVIVAVDACFLIAAYKTFPGQVSVTPYEDGLAYNKAMAQRRAQDALGWRASASQAAGAVIVEIRGPSEAAVSGLDVTGELRRPATEAGKFQLFFSETTPGRYVASAAPAPGAWDLRFSARGRTQPFEAERRLTWP